MVNIHGYYMVNIHGYYMVNIWLLYGYFMVIIWLMMVNKYHLVMTNSLPWKDPTFLIGKPSISIRAIYTMANC